MSEPVVLVCGYSAEEWTRVSYLKQIVNLVRPLGVDIHYSHITRAPIHLARQAASETALNQNATWLCQFDDDMVFEPDVIQRLLSHNQDVVCALAYGRRPPFKTCVYSSPNHEMKGIEHTGLRRVDLSGFAVSLIKIDVFRRLQSRGVCRWWGNFNETGEDFYFSKVLADAGEPLHVDTDLIVGHIGDPTVIDEKFKKEWETKNEKTRD